MLRIILFLLFTFAAPLLLATFINFVPMPVLFVLFGGIFVVGLIALLTHPVPGKGRPAKKSGAL
jgi:hypothetical protein